ncbi:hypothetical protein D9M72_201640 [compost metagenome]
MALFNVAEAPAPVASTARPFCPVGLSRLLVIIRLSSTAWPPAPIFSRSYAPPEMMLESPVSTPPDTTFNAPLTVCELMSWALSTVVCPLVSDA